MELKEIMSMTCPHKELIATLNAKSIIGRIRRESETNLHWIRFCDAEQAIFDHDREERKNNDLHVAAFAEYLKGLRKKDTFSFYQLKNCAVVLSAYNLISDDLVKVFYSTDDEYIRSELGI